MEFRLLGPLEVWEDGRPLSLGGTKQRALLGEPILVTRPPGYMLRVDFERLDLHRYGDCSRRAAVRSRRTRQTMRSS